MTRNRSDTEMYNLRTYVDRATWDRLLRGTASWPAGKRHQAGIARYAMSELEGDLETSPADVKDTPVDEGTQSVQVTALDVEEAKTWSRLARKYGTGERALRVALANLLRALRA